jgi:rhodanese-related sulfurtransferase
MFQFLRELIGGSSTDYKSLVDNGAMIVDVRTQGEYQGGHINGSVNIPLDQIKRHIPDLKQKNKIIITCCRSGARSGMAADLLSGSGLTAHNGGPWNRLQQEIM